MSSTEGATAYAAGVSAVPAFCMLLGSLLLMRAQISAKVQAVFQARLWQTARLRALVVSPRRAAGSARAS